MLHKARTTKFFTNNLCFCALFVAGLNSVGKIYLFAVGQLTHNHLYKVSGMCIISTCVSTYFYKSKMFVFKIFCNDVEKKQKIIELYERFLKSCVSILIYSTTSYITSELRERSKYCTYIPACLYTNGEIIPRLTFNNNSQCKCD